MEVIKWKGKTSLFVLSKKVKCCLYAKKRVLSSEKLVDVVLSVWIRYVVYL